jgi:thioredoxin 1
MQSITLDPDQRTRLADALTDDSWIIACLCADWCGTCRDYRDQFEQLALRFPQLHFVWIDIEDEADVVGDLDINDFPTLLIQHGDTVAFFGMVLPDQRLAERLINAQLEQDTAALQAGARSSNERIGWQDTCNLRVLLRSSLA